MAEQFGIRLSVAPGDLVKSINNAISQINNGNSLSKIKIGVDTSQLDEALQRVKAEIATITGKTNAPNSNGISGNNNITIDPNTISEKIKAAVSGLNITTPVEIPVTFKNIQEAVADLQQQANGVVINLGAANRSSDNNVSNAVKQVTEELRKQEQAERDVANAAKESSNTAVKAKSVEADVIARTIGNIENAIKRLNSITNKSILQQNKGDTGVAALMNDVEKLKSDYQGLIDALKSSGTTENLAKVKTEMESLRAKTEEASLRAGELATNFKNVTIDENVTRRLSDLHAKILTLMNANSAGLDKSNPNSGKTFRTELEAIIEKFPEAQAKGLTFVKSLENGVMGIDAQMKVAGATGKTLFQELQEKATKFIKWTAMTLVITKARMYIRQLFTTVYELDTALIDLRKTFAGSTKDLEAFYFESNKIAKQMGVTTQEIIEQAAAWSRLGYNTTEAVKKMSEYASMFAAISPDMDVDTATNGLVSIMKAFDIDPDNVLDGILSKINIIGNTAATSNGEIVEMLEKSSSAMKEANNTLEETIALETAAVEITRDASSVGNAYKTIAMRIRGYDEETEEFIGNVEELSGKIAELTKTAATPGGISLFTDANKTTYKSTYQLLKDISKIYDQLTDKQQAESCLNVQKCA